MAGLILEQQIYNIPEETLYHEAFRWKHHVNNSIGFLNFFKTIVGYLELDPDPDESVIEEATKEVLLRNFCVNIWENTDLYVPPKDYPEYLVEYLPPKGDELAVMEYNIQLRLDRLSM